MGQFLISPDRFAVGSHGFFGPGKPKSLGPPSHVNHIVFVSGIVNAGVVDVTAPGVAPPVLTLSSPHPGAIDFTQNSGGLLVSGDSTEKAYSLVTADFGLGLIIAIVGSTFSSTDITAVHFVGADSVTYSLGAADFFNTRTDAGDVTLQYGFWEWLSVPTAAFADGIQTDVAITSTFLL